MLVTMRLGGWRLVWITGCKKWYCGRKRKERIKNKIEKARSSLFLLSTHLQIQQKNLIVGGAGRDWQCIVKLKHLQGWFGGLTRDLWARLVSLAHAPALGSTQSKTPGPNLRTINVQQEAKTIQLREVINFLNCLFLCAPKHRVTPLLSQFSQAYCQQFPLTILHLCVPEWKVSGWCQDGSSSPCTIT